MYSHDPAGDMNRDDGLGAALRALPAATPPLDLWPDLARRLQPRQVRRHRFVWPAALAASLLLGVLWSRSALHETASDSTAAVPADAAPMQVASASEIDALRARSRDIEGWLGALSAQPPQDGRSLMAAAEVEDLVSFIDVQLSAARDDPEALPLWRQRVALLEDLAVIRSAPQALLAGTANADPSLPVSL